MPSTSIVGVDVDVFTFQLFQDANGKIKHPKMGKKSTQFFEVKRYGIVLRKADSFNSNEFLHFNVFLFPDNYSIPKEHVFLSVPQKVSLVSDYKSKNLIPYRTHYIDLKGIDKKVAVLVSKNTGKLKNNILFAYYEGS